MIPVRKVLLPVLLLATLVAEAQQIPRYRESFRPRYHFSPEKNWMNDPNGLVYHQGEWHLFYQYNPFGDQWGHMSWGHAVSQDLLSWTHLPIAIPEENGIMAFSGSVVIDSANTAGFGAGAMVAIYTGHRVEDGLQTQFIAHSRDRGRTWERYAGNPVLTSEFKDFRDPKVIWHESSKRWVMVVAVPLERKVRFYASKDLKAWELLDEFGPAGAVEGVWECPDFFPLALDGDPRRMRWILEVDMSGGSAAGGSGGQYFVGDFDGRTFTPDPTLKLPLWQDYGRDYYASTTFSGTGARRIQMAWMTNLQYAGAVPTSPWRGSQTLPRELKLISEAGHPVLVQQPVAEVKTLRGPALTRKDEALPEGLSTLVGASGETMEIIAEIEPGEATEVAIDVRRSGAMYTRVGWSRKTGEVYVDRTHAGVIRVHDSFAGRHAAPLALVNGRLKLHLFVDHNSVEVFAGDGRVTLTDLIFPDPDNRGVTLFADRPGARIVSLQYFPLKPSMN